MDELKLLIASNLDVTEFLDIIGYDLADLLDKMDEEIEEYQSQLLRACT
jgi:hypothetical protein